MNRAQVERDIKKSMGAHIKSKGLKKMHLTDAEYYKELYTVAVDKIMEMKK